MTLFPTIDGFTFHGEQSLPDRTEYLIGDFLPMTGVGLLVGKPGTGKSFLTIAMAAAIASGAAFLGQPVAAAGGATMFIAGEGLETYPSRVEASYLGLPPEHRDRLAAMGCPDLLPVTWGYGCGLREDAAFRLILDRAVELASHLSVFAPFGLRLIVVDTIPAVLGFRDENSAAEAQGAFNKLLLLSKATGAFVLGVMHPGKNKKSGDVRGSGVFEGSPDMILTAKMGANGNGTLSVTKARGGGAQNASWGYRLVPIVLPNGDPLVYVDSVARAPSATIAPKAEGIRLTRDASDVNRALRNAVNNHPISWQSPQGFTMFGTDEDAIRAQLARIKTPTSTDVQRYKDALRQSYKRGIDRLLQENLIAEHDHDDGRKVYWHVQDNADRNGLSGQG